MNKIKTVAEVVQEDNEESVVNGTSNDTLTKGEEKTASSSKMKEKSAEEKVKTGTNKGVEQPTSSDNNLSEGQNSTNNANSKDSSITKKIDGVKVEDNDCCKNSTKQDSTSEGSAAKTKASNKEVKDSDSGDSKVLQLDSIKEEEPEEKNEKSDKEKKAGVSEETSGKSTEAEKKKKVKNGVENTEVGEEAAIKEEKEEHKEEAGKGASEAAKTPVTAGRKKLVAKKKKDAAVDMKSPQTPAKVKEESGGVPVPDGWSRVVVQRSSGASAGKFDVYYFSPLGKKLRSKNEVAKHCEENQFNVDMDVIVFTHKKCGGTPVQAGKPSVVKTPKTTTPKTPKAPKNTKVSKTPKAPKTEPNRKRKLGDKSEGKGKGRVDLEVSFKKKGHTSKNTIELSHKTQSKSMGKFKIKYNFGIKRTSAGGNLPPAKRSRR